MKKKLVSMVLATMMCAAAMTGCGNVSQDPVEDIKIESQLFDAIQEAVDANNIDDVEDAVETDTAESIETEAIESTENEVVTEDAEPTLQDIAEQENLDIDVVQKLEDQFNPVIIAAEESWTEVLNMGKEWKDLVRDMNQNIAAKAIVKLIDVDLDNSTATYKVTTPDVIGFLAGNMKQASSVDDLADAIREALDNDSIPVKEREVSVPIHVSGSEVSIDTSDSEVMNSITGGFYESFKEVK